MIDVVLGTSQIEAVTAKEFASFQHVLDFGCTPTIALWVGELAPVVGKYRVDSVGNCFDQVTEEVADNAPGCTLMQLHKGKFRCSINGNEHMQLALCSAHFGNVDVEITPSCLTNSQALM